MQKSARILGKIYPTVQKYEPNLGQGFATRAKVSQKCWHKIPTGEKSQLNLRQGLPHRAKVQTDSRA